jgi:uncharacterized protein HemX
MEPHTPQPTQADHTPPATERKRDGGVGAMIASIIIILVIVFGAFYLLSVLRAEAPTIEESQGEDETSLTELEAELKAENFDNLDVEMEAIDAEFEAARQ